MSCSPTLTSGSSWKRCRKWQSSVPALRSALVIGIAEGDGNLSPVSFLRAYPNREMEVNLPALLALLQKANSISDLVRFFSESPLDGLQEKDSGSR